MENKVQSINNSPADVIISGAMFVTGVVGHFVVLSDVSLIFSCISGFFGVVFGRCLAEYLFRHHLRKLNPWYNELRILKDVLMGNDIFKLEELKIGK